MLIFFSYFFLIFAKNIGGSNEYPQSMFWSKNMKNTYTPVNPSFFYIKVRYKGVYILRTCFPDVLPRKYYVHTCQKLLYFVSLWLTKLNVFSEIYHIILSQLLKRELSTGCSIY